MQTQFTVTQHGFIRTALGLCLVLLSTSAAQAVELDAAKLGEVKPRMQKFVEEGQIAGAVTLVGTEKEIVHFEAVGSRSLEAQAPMTKDTMFRIASMTKPITALGIMLLVDEGKLAVDDPVEKHLPEFKGQLLVESRAGNKVTLTKPARPITVRDLLTHTSGLPNFPPGLSNLYSTRDRSLAEGILVISQQPLAFAPGSKWAYCNPGIDTLGRIIEVLSGKPYEVFLKERIFEPLGMKDTTFYPTEEQLARRAEIYGLKDGKLLAQGDPLIGPTPKARYAIPAGGLYSTASDLAQLYQMHLRGGLAGEKRIISEASLAAMTRTQTGDLQCGFTPGMSFGFGFAVVKEPQGATAMLSTGTYGHGGAFGTQGWIDPKRGVFYVLLIQRSGLANGDASDMRRDFQTLAAGAIK